jgi:hypothetical protein
MAYVVMDRDLGRHVIILAIYVPCQHVLGLLHHTGVKIQVPKFIFEDKTIVGVENLSVSRDPLLRVGAEPIEVFLCPILDDFSKLRRG